jgi:hypothetical protein
LNQPPHGSLTLFPLVLGGLLSRSNQSPIIEDLPQAKHQYRKLVRFALVHRQIYIINSINLMINHYVKFERNIFNTFQKLEKDGNGVLLH